MICFVAMDASLAILVLFNSISVILGRWEGDNERLWAKEPRQIENNNVAVTPISYAQRYATMALLRGVVCPSCRRYNRFNHPALLRKRSFSRSVSVTWLTCQEALTPPSPTDHIPPNSVDMSSSDFHWRETITKSV